MAAEDNLSGDQFARHLRVESDGEGVLNAFHPTAGHVGQLDYDPDNGIINVIYTSEEHRRKGVATAMWNHAQQHEKVKPRHSPSMTEEGHAWARSVGGNVPNVSRYVTY